MNTFNDNAHTYTGSIASGECNQTKVQTDRGANSFTLEINNLFFKGTAEEIKAAIIQAVSDSMTDSEKILTDPATVYQLDMNIGIKNTHTAEVAG